MGVTKYFDGRSKRWVLQWGGRNNRQYLWTGLQDRAAAEILRQQKERELALQHTGDLETRIAEVVTAKFEKTLDAIVEAKVVTILEARSKALTASGGKSLPRVPTNDGISKYIEANQAAGLSNSHIENIERQLRKFVAHAKVSLVSELTTEHLTRWMNDTRKVEELGNKSVSDRFQIAKKWLSWMADPQPLKPKRAAKRRVLYFTAEDYGKILAHAELDPNPKAAVLVAMALYGGFRLEELFVMDHKDVRFEEREIDVGQGEKTTKTGRARTTPILDQLLKYLLPLRGGKDRIFSGWANKQNLGEFFKKLVKKSTGRDNCGLLIARHSAHSWLVHAGVNLGKIASWMGNSPRIIERNYLARIPDHAKAVLLSFYGKPLEAGGLPSLDAKEGLG